MNSSDKLPWLPTDFIHSWWCVEKVWGCSQYALTRTNDFISTTNWGHNRNQAHSLALKSETWVLRQILTSYGHQTINPAALPDLCIGWTLQNGLKAILNGELSLEATCKHAFYDLIVCTTSTTWVYNVRNVIDTEKEPDLQTSLLLLLIMVISNRPWKESDMVSPPNKSFDERFLRAGNYSIYKP